MSDKRFEVVVLERFCKGCGLCVEFCEAEKLYITPRPNRAGVRVAAVRPDVDCTGCLQCATICPDAAVCIRRLETPAGAAAGTASERPGT
jgi:2-oxoglutarate ferredoxin oxidoreductase subunit delta